MNYIISIILLVIVYFYLLSALLKLPVNDACFLVYLHVFYA